jgi:phosphatidate cytidylyltransferase
MHETKAKVLSLLSLQMSMFNFLSGLSNLQQRIIAGITGGAIVINAIYWSEWSYFVLFFAICFLANLEFYDLLIADKKKPNKLFGTVIGMVIYTLVFVIEKEYISSKFFLTLFPLCAFIFIYELYYSKKKPFNNVAYTILGILYVSIPFSVMHVATFANGQYSWQICLGCLFLLWASDTGAYFAGKNFGRTKLFPRVSPGKTWEGSLGGGLTSIGIAVLISNFFTELNVWQWVCLAIIIVIAGSYGDLVESSFKRSLKIKDSGSAIPGHGGFLDRFDGWLLSAPFIATFLEIFRNIHFN